MNIEPLFRGMFILPDGLPVPFLYNPDELEQAYSVNYAKKQALGMSHPRNHYTGGSDKTLEFSMTVRDKMSFGKFSMPFPAEIYIGAIHDLQYPIYRNGAMIDTPPSVYIMFGFKLMRVKIQKVQVTMKKWGKKMELKYAVMKIGCIEVVTESKERWNSYKSITNFPRLAAGLFTANGLKGK